MTLARWTAEQVEAGGWIRRMFAEGQRLRAQDGGAPVYDLSLGQPLEAPVEVHEALVRAAAETFPLRHAYMPNLGYPDVRQRVAEEVGFTGVTASSVALTGGAAGAICLALRTFVDAGAEVVGLAPHFPEFAAYCATSGMRFCAVHVDPLTLRVDIDGLVRALTTQTAAMIINTPSNPSGHVIETAEMTQITDVLEHHNRRTGRRILLIVDEAYRSLVYEPAQRVEPFDHYEHTVVARSFSKDLGLAGERIGYLAVHPSLGGDRTAEGLETCMRALGMVSAPATAQRALLQLPSWHVDIGPYRSLRDTAVAAARAAWLDAVEPQGGIFLWLRSPWPDTLEYAAALAARRVLVTPGIAFGSPTGVRACFTASAETVAAGLALAGDVARDGAAAD